jgi:TatD DNase family protein
MLIDTHCHLNDPFFEKSVPDVLTRARAAGVSGFIVLAYDHASLSRTAQLASSYPGVLFPAFGIHPWHVDEAVRDEEILSLIRKNKTVAIGEIGLDFSPECPPQEVQVRSLVRQLNWAQEFELPVAIHCRKAYDRLYEILLDFRGKLRGVIHSFSGNREMMLKLIDLGFYISFSGSVTRATARKYHKNAEAVPLGRMLLETDAPSIATETTVAAEVEPRHIVEVAQQIARLRGISFEEVCDRTTENARRLFDLS